MKRMLATIAAVGALGALGAGCSLIQPYVPQPGHTVTVTCSAHRDADGTLTADGTGCQQPVDTPDAPTAP